MEFKNSFLVDRPLKEAWRLLLDVPSIAACVPGASLTEVVDGDTYKGRVAVRLGPVALSFDGTAKIAARDEESATATVQASGTDAKGRGGAQSVVHFSLEPMDQSTRVNVRTDLRLSGSVAQYGRASGLIADVADQILRQFERNLSARLASDHATAREAITAAPAAAPADLHVIGLKVLWNAMRRWLRALRARALGVSADHKKGA